MASVEIKGVTKSFDNKVIAVNNVTIRVEDQQFLTLLGPSGCGKTTLLRLIAGLEQEDSGEIFIDGKKVNHLLPSQRDVAMVFQSYALYPHMNVYENIAVSLKLRKMPKDEIKERVNESASLLGIDNLLERKPKALSGGQRQRVALARALVRKPKVFLLDEPLSNLDALLREHTRSELKLLFSKIKATVIYVTHDQIEAMSMSDKIAVLDDGRIQQIDTPYNIYNHPANIFVAGFVGSPKINLLNAMVDKNTLRIGQISFMLNEEISTKEVIVGIRPEDVEVAPKYEEGTYPAQISVLEPIGSFTVATLQFEGGELKAIVKPSSYSPNTKIWFRINTNKIHLFNPTSQLLINHE
jgi:multiple sugar transport system ATP-binding protein